MLVLSYILLVWMRNLRVNHAWLSVFVPPLDEQLFLSRPQRIAILCVSLLANFAAAALFFFSTADSPFQTAIAGVLSALVMIPFEETFPFIFEAVNTYRSYTVRVREAVKERYAEQTKKQQQMIVQMVEQQSDNYGSTRIPPSLAEASKANSTRAVTASVVPNKSQRLKVSTSRAIAGIEVAQQTPGFASMADAHAIPEGDEREQEATVVDVVPSPTQPRNSHKLSHVTPMRSPRPSAPPVPNFINSPKNTPSPSRFVVPAGGAGVSNRQQVMFDSGVPYMSPLTTSMRGPKRQLPGSPIQPSVIPTIKATHMIAGQLMPLVARAVNRVRPQDVAQISMQLKDAGFDTDSDEDVDLNSFVSAARDYKLTRSSVSSANVPSSLEDEGLTAPSVPTSPSISALRLGAASVGSNRPTLPPLNVERGSNVSSPLQSVMTIPLGNKTPLPPISGTGAASPMRGNYFFSDPSSPAPPGSPPAPTDDMPAYRINWTEGSPQNFVPFRGQSVPPSPGGRLREVVVPESPSGEHRHVGSSAPPRLTAGEATPAVSLSKRRGMNIWNWSLLSMLSVLQAFMGFFTMVYAVYVVATEVNRTYTEIVMGVCGLVMMLSGLYAFFSLRDLNYRRSIVLFVLSIATEFTGAGVLLGLNMSDNMYVLSIIGGIHGLGLLGAALVVMWILLSRKYEMRREAENRIMVRRLEEQALGDRRPSVQGRTQMATRKIATAIRYAL